MKYTLEELNRKVEEANEIGGTLGLNGLTSIPEGFNPTVGGTLGLDGLTSIPEGFNPTVGGSLWLNGLTSMKRKTVKINRLVNGFYKPGEYLYADRILTHIKGTKKVDKYTLYIGKIPHKNVVSDGTHFAHCDSLRDGIADLVFKTAKDRGAKQFKGRSLDEEMTVPELVTMYRIITGACRQGSERFVNSLGQLKERYTIREAIQLTKGQYGAERFAEFFGE